VNPRTALIELMYAIESGDADEITEHLHILDEWFGRGGYIPSVTVKKEGTTYTVEI
jgi:hypothetical protein